MAEQNTRVKITDAASAKLLMEAFSAAEKAAADHIQNNPDVWYPCGFAWVVIKPARGPLVKYLKHTNMGRTSDSGGFTVYNPSKNHTQWMDAKYEGAKAFAKVLTDAGYKCYAYSRID
jgi:hypothetical protein